MREFFVETKFHKKSLRMIAKAIEIIAEYEAEEMKLTLRQLYYQFVARGIIPNRQNEYNKLGKLISDARLAGLIDWQSIEDRTRNRRVNSHWDDPDDAISSIAEQYGIDKWADQAHRVEVWIEKEALVGVIHDICKELDVPYFPCRGYVSQSEQWRAGKRFEYYVGEGQKPVVLHLGDHDPSGIDMTRDNEDRLGMFAWNHVEVDRIALNMDQVEQYDPPPNPAKITDSRFKTYVRDYGTDSWELDALDPTVLRDLISEKVASYRSDKKWKKAVKKEKEQIDSLKEISTYYPFVSRLASKMGDNFDKIEEFLDSLD